MAWGGCGRARRAVTASRGCCRARQGALQPHGGSCGATDAPTRVLLGCADAGHDLHIVAALGVDKNWTVVAGALKKQVAYHKVWARCGAPRERRRAVSLIPPV